jgi:hypothetical protein
MLPNKSELGPYANNSVITWYIPLRPLLPSERLLTAPGRTFHTNTRPKTNTRQAGSFQCELHSMLQLFGFSALRTKSRSHPQLSCITKNTISQSAKSTPTAQHSNTPERTRRLFSDMGKSNKFDCTNRRNEGADLGKSIGDAALKELEKTRKDAVRQAGRARKVSTGSLTGGDHEVTGVHHIDLIAPSKALTDDGVAAMVEGLHAALKAGSSNASVTLEGLNIRDNGLTTASLATLAPVIELAKNDLKTIVLSDNNITVASDIEARQWETFLAAFKSCKTLRRLDLSGNTELGARALEIFSKVYCNEPHVDPIALGGDRSVYTLDETQESDDNKSFTFDEDQGSLDYMTSGILLRRRCGLRSIPYISFQNIGINDTGALWLSYVLENHYYPNQLVSEINAAPATSSVDAYRQGAVEGGIDWSGHKGSIGRDGLALLTKTEVARKQLLQNDTSSLFAGSPISVGLKSLEPRRHSRASTGDRRASIRSIHTDDGGEHELSEVESVRKRIQRHIIEDRGVTSVNLWNAALQVVSASRKLAYIAPPTSRRRTYAGPCLFTSDSDQALQGRSQRLDSVADINPSEPTSPSKKDSTATITRKTGKSYAATLADLTRASTAITEVTNTPATPKRMFTAHRKGAFSEGSDLQSLSERLSNVKMLAAEPSPERFLDWQKDKQEREAFTYRDTTTACQLPMSVLDRVLAFALPTHDITVSWTVGTEGEVVRAEDGAEIQWPGKELLSRKQLRNAFEWGQNSESLAKERKWAGMADSGQQLLLLDAIGCLAYEA